MCRKCPYANCCQSYVQVHRAHRANSSSLEAGQKVEQFVGVLLREILLKQFQNVHSEGKSTGKVMKKEQKVSKEERKVTKTIQKVEQFVDVLFQKFPDAIDSDPELFDDPVEQLEELKLQKHKNPRRPKLMRSQSRNEEEERRLELDQRRKASLEKASGSPKLKRNAVSWAFEGHSAL